MLTIKEKVIGGGKPLVCVPVMGHKKQEIVEEGHDASGVYLTLARQAVGLYDAFHRSGEAIVFQKYRRGFVLRHLFDLDLTAVLFFQLGLTFFCMLCRNITVYKKYVLGLQQSTQHTVLLGAHGVVVRHKLDLCPLIRQGL